MVRHCQAFLAYIEQHGAMLLCLKKTWADARAVPVRTSASCTSRENVSAIPSSLLRHFAVCLLDIFFVSDVLKFSHRAFFRFLYLFRAVLLFMMLFLVLIHFA